MAPKGNAIAIMNQNEMGAGLEDTQANIMSVTDSRMLGTDNEGELRQATTTTFL